MLSFLQTIAETVDQIGGLALWGIIEALNVVFAAVEVAFNAVSFVTLPEVPAPPSMIEGINWYFPIGALVSVATTMAGSYGAFLAVRWLFKKVGTL